MGKCANGLQWEYEGGREYFQIIGDTDQRRFHKGKWDVEERILKIGEREKMVPHEQKATRRGKQIWWKFREPVSRVKGVLGSGVQCWIGEWTKYQAKEFSISPVDHQDPP